MKNRDAISQDPSSIEVFKVWAHIGIFSFGGPAAQISLMHRIIVDEKKWLSEQQFLNALSFCMLLPGPEAMQLATYSGWRLHGVRGGLVAGLLFVLPGASIVLALSMIYAAWGSVQLVETIFVGIKATVVIIVIEALLRVSKKALQSVDHWAISGVAFVGIFFFAVPFPLIIFLAAIYGFFRLPSKDRLESASEPPRLRETLKTATLWLAIWLAPLILLTSILGKEHILSQIGWFFSKLAIVTFGGAYAVLAYMGQDVVIAHGWLNAGQVMDGLGLAETTPGPLILVTEFVGYLTAYGHEGSNSFLLGLVGALVSLWATFAPCFMWIFTGAPYIEWLNGQPRLKGALLGITAAVVGVILNLSIWFALHVFFGKVELIRQGYLHLWTPELTSLNEHVVLLALLSGFLLLKFHWQIPTVLGVAAISAIGLNLI